MSKLGVRAGIANDAGLRIPSDVSLGALDDSRSRARGSAADQRPMPMLEMGIDGDHDAARWDPRRLHRTLTNLYNERPTWLRDIHERLDRAVLAAYGWPAEIADEDLLGRLLELNLERAGWFGG